MANNDEDNKPVTLDQRSKEPTIYSSVWGNALDSLQRLICLGLGTWHYIYTGDLFGSLIILAAGFIDARIAKEVLKKFLKINDQT